MENVNLFFRLSSIRLYLCQITVWCYLLLILWNIKSCTMMMCWYFWLFEDLACVILGGMYLTADTFQLSHPRLVFKSQFIVKPFNPKEKRLNCSCLVCPSAKLSSNLRTMLLRTKLLPDICNYHTLLPCRQLSTVFSNTYIYNSVAVVGCV